MRRRFDEQGGRAQDYAGDVFAVVPQRLAARDQSAKQMPWNRKSGLPSAFNARARRLVVRDGLLDLSDAARPVNGRGLVPTPDIEPECIQARDQPVVMLSVTLSAYSAKPCVSSTFARAADAGHLLSAQVAPSPRLGL